MVAILLLALASVVLQVIAQNAPARFARNPYTYTIAESYGQNVSNYVNVSINPNDPVFASSENGISVFYWVIQQPSNMFYIKNSTTGFIYVTEGTVLDRERNLTFTFTVGAFNGYSLNATTTVIVYLDDVNDNPPVLALSPPSVSIADDAAVNQVICNVTASDPDDSTKFFFPVYKLSNDTSGDFTLRSQQIVVNSTLDYNMQQLYYLVVTVQDDSYGTVSFASSATFIVTVTDADTKYPFFNSTNYIVSIYENATYGTSVIQVHAADGDLGINDTILYSIVAGNHNGSFSVNDMTGLITVATGRLSPIVKVYTLTVQGREKNPYYFATLVQVTINIIDVNDHTPTFARDLYATTVPENSGIDFSVIRLSVTDLDVGTNAHFLLKIDNPNVPFSIDAGGDILRVSGTIDYENTTQYMFKVLAIEDQVSSGARTGSTCIVINVTNVNEFDPVFNLTTYSASIAEKQIQNIHVATVHATDLDGGIVRYSIVKNDSGPFEIDPTTGNISITMELDYSKKVQYKLTVQAIDGAVMPYQRTGSCEVIVNVTNVNDKPPEFIYPPLNVSIPENSKIGYSIYTFQVSDPDDDALVLTFQSGNENGLFRIDGYTLQVNTTFDYENSTLNYTLTFVLNDSIHTVNYTLQVFVTDVNDNSPIFENISYNFQVSENASSTCLGTIKASDADQGLFGVVFYSLIGPGNYSFAINSSTGPHSFAINSSTGLICTKHKIDREYMALYSLIGVASDSDPNVSSRRTQSVNVTITVTDINDNAPIFTLSSPVFYVRENTGIMTNSSGSLIILNATDLDEGSNSVLTYSIVSGNNDTLFQISPTSGLLFRNPMLAIDRERTSQYSLLVMVKDGGMPSLSSSLNVTIIILDENDNTPLFSNTNYSVSILESTPINNVTYQFNATDADTGSNSRIMYTVVKAASSFKSSSFAISETGQLTLAVALDREMFEGPYSIVVIATDGGLKPLTGTVTLLVYVQDVNDNKPLFFLDVYTFSVKPSLSPVSIGTVTAYDKDKEGTLNSVITYNITSVSENCLQLNFTIDSLSGNISAKSLQRLLSCTITIQATDKGQIALSSLALVNITVEEFVEAVPTFNASFYRLNVAEDTSVNTRFQIPNAQSEATIVITYSTNFSGPFAVDSSSGELILTSMLKFMDKSLYSFTIWASNPLSESSRSSLNITIDVVQINLFTPVFDNSYYISSVPEDANISTPVIKVKAKDTDIGLYGRVSYSIVGGNLGNAFSINSSTGQLETLAVLNKTAVSSYILTISATDEGSPPANSSATVMIVIQDVNNNSPQFDRFTYFGHVPENRYSGYPVVFVSATDADTGINGSVRFRLNDTANFQINNISGEVFTMVPFDYETQKQYFVSVVAYDLGSPSLSTSATIAIDIIDVNDNVPKFFNFFSALNVSESVLVNSVILNVTAMDSDAGNNSIITYGLANDQGYFTIDNCSGAIFVRTALDFEAVSNFNLTIIATDCGFPRLSNLTNLTIKIVDEDDMSPVFAQDVYAVTLNASDTFPFITLQAAAGGSGENATITFSLEDSINGTFNINSTANNVTIFNAQPFSQPAYSIKVVASSGTHRTSAVVSIVVLGINNSVSDAPNFGVGEFSFSIIETAPVNSHLDPPLYASVNSGTTLTYTLNGCLSFKVDSKTGIISLAGVLDREATPFYTCNFTAKSDNRNFSSTVKLNITVLDVNDNAPTFSQSVYLVDVLENAREGSYLGKIVATDDDIGSNARITYSIISGDDIGRPKFAIHPSTGVLLATTNSVDREQKSLYILTIQATDNIFKVSTNLRITVQDQNDNTPIFSKSQITVNKSEGSSFITTILATDADIGVNSEIRYSIGFGNTGSLRIDEYTGLLTADPYLDYETRAFYNITILAVDQSALSCEMRTASINMNINLIDINDNEPIFSQETYDVAIFENLVPQQIVLNVTATDADSGTNAEFFYRILPNTSSAFFSIDDKSGSIRISSVLDRESIGVHLLVVEAVDKGTPQLTGRAAVHINLLDVNDNPPQFNSSYYSRAISEDVPVGTSVIQLVANDADSSAVLKYSVQSGDSYPYGFFKINGSSGLIQTARRLDNELRALTNLTIQVSDGFNNGSTTVQIFIMNGNDKPPRFAQAKYKGTVLENSPPGTRVIFPNGRVTAIDPDVPSTLLVFDLAGAAQSFFTINRLTGVITVKQGAVLDRESRNGYFVFGTIVATDNNGLGLSSIAQLTVEITNENDNAPVFSQPLGYSLALFENTVMQANFSEVGGRDADIQNFTYRIIEAHPNSSFSLFAISATNGLINLQGQADRELFTLSNQTLQIADNGTPSLFSITSLQVAVLDQNDMPPAFNQAVYFTTILENITVGSPVLKLTAVDPDFGPGGIVSYKILQTGNDYSLYFINAATGLVTTTQPLHFEVKRTTSITIEACDGGSPVLCASAVMVAQIEDTNNNIPEFTSDSYMISIPSDLPINSSVIHVAAVDRDWGTNAQLTYSLISNQLDLLYVNSSTGLVKLNRAISDSEVGHTFSFMIKATDNGIPPLTGHANILIMVFNSSIPLARFQSIFTETSLLENTNSSVITCNTTAANGSYILLNSNGTNLFTLSFTSGLRVEISTSGLDREQQSQYTLLIGGNNSFQSVYVKVIDVNDNAPIFLQSLYSFSVPENTIFVVGNITAFDLDEGSNANISYAINQTTNPNGTFTIDSSTGQLSTNMTLDREKLGFYNLTVIATDGGSPSMSSSVVVQVTVLDVNDNKPMFTQNYYNVSVLRNVGVGYPLLLLLASDIDLGSNAEIVYSITSGNLTLFSINNITGLFSIMGNLNLTSAKTQSLVVRANNPGTSVLSEVNVTVNIADVNTCPPIFSPSIVTSLFLTEGPESTKQVVSLGAYVTDCDIGPSGIRYSIIAGNQSLFVINSTTGNITTTAPLDRETQSSFLITVQAKDGFDEAHSLSSQIEIQIIITDINDNAPEFPANTFSISLSEDFPVGQVMFSIIAVDKDATTNAIITYTLEGAANSLSVASGSISLTTVLDREKVERFNFTIRASDGNFSSSANVLVTVLDVNDNSPVFLVPSPTVLVPENTPPGTEIYILRATDADTGLNGQITYMFDAANGDNTFDIEPSSGFIRVKQNLDYETTNLHILTVVARDHGSPSRSTLTVLRIRITDVNDNPPRFLSLSYRVSVQENIQINTLVLIVTATDRDLTGTPAANISYFLTGPNSDYFKIDSRGMVFTDHLLDRENTSSYSLTIVASNSYASPMLLSTASLAISVTDVNDNRPFFIQQNSTITVSELTPIGEVVFSVYAIDYDQPQTINSLVSYRIESKPAQFDIKSSTGDIFVSGSLDWSSTPNYQLLILASDGGQPALSSYIRLNITILDENNIRPTFNSYSHMASVYEDAYMGIPVWLLVQDNLGFSDRDNLYNSNSSYIIERINKLPVGTPNSLFSINETGALFLLNKIDREQIARYTLEVGVFNIRIGKGPSCSSTSCTLQDTTTVMINVLDVNDNSPAFNSSLYYAYLSSSAPVGTEVITMNASDPDEGTNGTLGISYTLGSPVEQFRIERKSGTVYTRTSITQFDEVFFKLEVIATDGGALRSAPTVLSILVLDATKRILIVFRCELDTIYGKQGSIAQSISNATSMRVTIEQVRRHINVYGEEDLNRTDFIFHVNNTEKNTVLDFETFIALPPFYNNTLNFIDVVQHVVNGCFAETVLPLSQLPVPLTPTQNTTTTTPPYVPLPPRLDIQIIIVLIFCGILSLGAFILIFLSFYQRHAALHDARTKLLSDVFYNNQGADMVENIHLQNLNLDEIQSNMHIQHDNPIFLHPFENWVGTDPSKMSLSAYTTGESSSTKQDNPLYEEQEIRMDMFADDSDEENEIDGAELLAAAIEDDDNEDNAVTSI